MKMCRTESSESYLSRVEYMGHHGRKDTIDPHFQQLSRDSCKLSPARRQDQFDCSLLRGDPLNGCSIEEFEFAGTGERCAHHGGVVQVHHDDVSRPLCGSEET